MIQVSRSKSLAAGALFALGAASTPALADDALSNLGPVGPREPILVQVGEQRFIAFYTKERGECAVSAVTWRMPTLTSLIRRRAFVSASSPVN